jgi:hypothetical protein
MKKLLILLVVYIYTSQVRAQDIQESTLIDISINKPKLNNENLFRIFVTKSMINAIDFDKLVKAPKGFAHLMSVNIIFNGEGRIDTSIISTKRNNYFELKKNPSTELKSHKPIPQYANCIVILPILYVRQNETNINLENRFLEGFVDLFPPQFLNKKKNIILLKPEVNPFSQIK